MTTVETSYDLIGSSSWIQKARRFANLAAGEIEEVVLLQGETGTGKGVMARLIHELSAHPFRPHGQFYAINCGSVPEALFESEVYGHERGSFTNATEQKRGLLELAEDGTLFIDELENASPAIQAKLLGVIEARTFRRVGGTREISVKARIIAATNVDVVTAVRDGKVRNDLFYRLETLPFTMPPLRQRTEDIPLLVKHFLSKRTPVKECSEETIQLLCAYKWPGNVRELRNVIVRAAILSTPKTTIEPRHAVFTYRTPESELADSSPHNFTGLDGGPLALSEVLATARKRQIEYVLRETNGNVARAASILKIARSSLIVWITKYSLRHLVRKGR